MIDLNRFGLYSALYAFDFKTHALLTFNGEEVTGLDQPIRKTWNAQPTASFLATVKPLVCWSPTPEEAASPFIFTRDGVWIYRFSRVDYTLSKRKGLKGAFGDSKFVDPASLVNLAARWYTTVLEAWKAS